MDKGSAAWLWWPGSLKLAQIIMGRKTRRSVVRWNILIYLFFKLKEEHFSVVEIIFNNWFLWFAFTLLDFSSISSNTIKIFLEPYLYFSKMSSFSWSIQEMPLGHKTINLPTKVHCRHFNSFLVELQISPLSLPPLPAL